ncbi:MAG TPA: alpha/beta hydrolase [Rhizobium sp.]
MSLSSFTASDGVRLNFETAGTGLPFIWQHGLGADRNQPAEVFPDIAGYQRITLECRGHGGSEVGDRDKLSIERFSQDVLELMRHLELTSVIIGGISLGAAIALRVAAMAPSSVRGVILARPAWVIDPAPDTLKPYVEVARLLKTYGPIEGAQCFEQSPSLAEVEKASPDNAQSLRWFFERPRRDSTEDLLSRIPLDGPGVSEETMRSLSVPVLVIGNACDYVHPIATARALADIIPGAEFREITGKSISKDAYVADFKRELAMFLTEAREELP